MSTGTWLGAVLAISGGALQGGFAVPMKFARDWKHENIWFVFALTGLVVFPWMVTPSTVPSLGEVYRSAPPGLLAVIVLCGIGWGAGAVLVGLAFRLLGIGLAFAIILGLSSLLGSLVPFLFQPSRSLSNSKVWLYLLGSCVMLIGIAIVSIAGSIREQAESRERGLGHDGGRRFVPGLLIAIVAGILSSLLSDAIAFTSPMVDHARQLGASPVWASNVVLAPTTTGGSLANFAYCAFMMRRNQSAVLLWQSSMKRNWIYGIVMGACWYGGLAAYGLGAQQIGSVNGWPLFIGAMILSSSAAGFLTGEWRSAGRHGNVILCGGSLVILIALIVVGMAHGG